MSSSLHKNFKGQRPLLEQLKDIVAATTEKYPEANSVELLEKLFNNIENKSMFDIILALSVLIGAIEAKGPKSNNGATVIEQVALGATIFSAKLESNEQMPSYMAPTSSAVN